MSNQIRIPLYIVLVLLASISGYYALTSFGKMMDRASDRHAGIDEIEPERTRSIEETVSPASTDAPATPQPGTNTAAATPAPLTNNTAANTNTNMVAATEPVAPPPNEPAPSVLPGSGAARGSSGGGTRVGLWTALFLVSLVALGLLIANDVSHFAGNRALKTLYNDEGKGVANPEYEQAEQAWADGKFLDAIGLMRDYLRKSPREQHVAMRIAEIYEKDLGNYLAAALEYEEVLKYKLPSDRWGWAAIHLCNLYFRLNQEQKAYTLLRRLVKDYPETPAAAKARKRLEQVDGASLTQIPTETSVRDVTPSAPEDSSPSSNLPPGFRPRK